MKNKIKTSNIVLGLVIILLIAFTIRVLGIVERGGYEPSTLIGAVFAAALGEFGILGWIKNTKLKNDNGGNNGNVPGGDVNSNDGNRSGGVG